MLLVAFDIVHSEILCEQRIVSRRCRVFTDSALKVVIFLPYLQMSKNLRRDVARGERRILGSRTAKNVSGWIGQARWPDLRKSCGDLYALMLGGSMRRSGGPDWIRTSDPALIKRML